MFVSYVTSVSKFAKGKIEEEICMSSNLFKVIPMSKTPPQFSVKQGA